MPFAQGVPLHAGKAVFILLWAAGPAGWLRIHCVDPWGLAAADKGLPRGMSPFERPGESEA